MNELRISKCDFLESGNCGYGYEYDTIWTSRYAILKKNRMQVRHGYNGNCI